MKILSNSRKTGAVSSAPPKGLASSFLAWRRASATFALLSAIVPIVLAGVCCAASVSAPGVSDWKTVLVDRLPLYGHRNWIVIADSAYPAQTASGIETIYSNAG